MTTAVSTVLIPAMVNKTGEIAKATLPESLQGLDAGQMRFVILGLLVLVWTCRDTVTRMNKVIDKTLFVPYKANTDGEPGFNPLATDPQTMVYIMYGCMATGTVVVLVNYYIPNSNGVYLLTSAFRGLDTAYGVVPLTPVAIALYSHSMRIVPTGAIIMAILFHWNNTGLFTHLVNQWRETTAEQFFVMDMSSMHANMEVLARDTEYWWHVAFFTFTALHTFAGCRFVDRLNAHNAVRHVVLVLLIVLYMWLPWKHVPRMDEVYHPEGECRLMVVKNSHDGWAPVCYGEKASRTVSVFCPPVKGLHSLTKVKYVQAAQQFTIGEEPGTQEEAAWFPSVQDWVWEKVTKGAELNKAHANNLEANKRVDYGLLGIWDANSIEIDEHTPEDTAKEQCAGFMLKQTYQIWKTLVSGVFIGAMAHWGVSSDWSVYHVVYNAGSWRIVVITCDILFAYLTGQAMDVHSVTAFTSKTFIDFASLACCIVPVSACVKEILVGFFEGADHMEKLQSSHHTNKQH